MVGPSSARECLEKGQDPADELLSAVSGPVAPLVDTGELASDLESILVDAAKIGSDIIHRV